MSDQDHPVRALMNAIQPIVDGALDYSEVLDKDSETINLDYHVEITHATGDLRKLVHDALPAVRALLDAGKLAEEVECTEAVGRPHASGGLACDQCHGTGKVWRKI